MAMVAVGFRWSEDQVWWFWFALTTELGGCKGEFSPLIDNGGDLVERPLMAVLQMDLE